MPRLFLGNFEFEHTLAGAGGLPERLTRINHELAFCWLAIAAEDDALVVPCAFEPQFLEMAAANGLPRCRIVKARELPRLLAAGDWEVSPWGWTDQIRALLPRATLQNIPSAAAVRAANSRRFSFGLEADWGLGLPGARAIATHADLSDTLVRLSPEDRWVIKAEFGMSARERLLGAGPTMPDSAANWVRRRLASDGIVFFEPWVERIDEAGMQFDVPRSSEPTLLGITPLLVEPSGAYAGSRFDDDPKLTASYGPAIEVGRRAAVRAQELGYFGPIGIDAMRYRRPDGSVGLRPLQDINARYTMGRLSLGFRRLLRPDERGAWRHVRWSGPDGPSPAAWCEDFTARLDPAARTVRTSPFEIDGVPTRMGTIVVVEDSRLQPPSGP